MAGRFFANLNPFPLTLPSPRGGQKLVSPKEVLEGDWWSKLCGTRQLTEIDPEKYDVRGRKIVDGMDIRRSKGTRSPVREVRLNGENSRRQTVVSSRRKSKIETLADDVCSSGCEMSCEGSCELDVQGIEEFDHMRGVGEEYFCKYCSYSSIVKSDVEQHLQLKHKDELGIKDDGTADVSGEVVEKDPVNEDGDIVTQPEQETVTISDSVNVDVDDNSRFEDTEEDKGEVVEETEDYTKLADGTYVCKVCGKTYKPSKTAKSWLAKHINSEHR